MRTIKDVLKILNSSNGISLMETVLGTAIFAGVSLVLMKNMNTQNVMVSQNMRNLDIEQMLKIASDNLKKKSSCDAMIGGMRKQDLDGIELNETTLNDSFEVVEDVRQSGNSQGETVVSMEENFKKLGAQVAAEYAGGVTLESIKFDVGDVAGGVPEGDVVLNIQFDFRKRRLSKLGEDQDRESMRRRKIIRNVVSVVTLRESESGETYIECPGYIEEKIATTGIKHACERLGGNIAPSGVCEFNDFSNDWDRAIKDIFCRTLDQNGGGAFTGSFCNGVNLRNNVYAQNISPSHITVNGQRRVDFTTDNCSSGNLKNLDIAGKNLDCAPLSFQCTMGALCP